nr:PREDICTED: uncharacterized protein LOC106487170 [Apteryx mantelli mantelli]
MQSLVLALLLFAALCSSSPLRSARDTPRTVRVDCSESSLIQETLKDIENLTGITKTTPLNDTTEQEHNVFTYLERFIQVLETSKLPMERSIALKLRRIHTARNSCTGWKNSGWNLIKEGDSLRILEDLLKFLNHYAYSEETNSGWNLIKEGDSLRILEDLLKFLNHYAYSEETNKNCADSHTEEFIKELEKIPSHTCIKRVKADLERLRENCPILKKSLPHGKKCSEITANFQHFKKNLEDFLKWLNQNKECNNIVISEPDFYTDGECTCPDR